jgi:hypothetical protein
MPQTGENGRRKAGWQDSRGDSQGSGLCQMHYAGEGLAVGDILRGFGIFPVGSRRSWVFFWYGTLRSPWFGSSSASSNQGLVGGCWRLGVARSRLVVS